MNPSLSRRRFIQTSMVAAGAGLVVGCSNDGDVVVMHSDQAPDAQLNAWVHIATNGNITVTVPSVEMGQGVKTSLAMLVAEEMDADWNQVKVLVAPWNSQFANGAMRMQMTGGSTSIASFWVPMRQVGAVAKASMLNAAAARWQVDAESLQAQNGSVTDGNRSLTYAELASDAALQSIDPEDVSLKQPEQFRLIGKDIPRIDMAEKTNGKAIFGVDVDVPNMLVATVARAPVFGGELKSINKDVAMAVRGVTAVVEIPNGVGVVADSYWQAKKGLLALDPQFTNGEEPVMSTADISAALRVPLDEKKIKLPKGASQVLEMEYEVPYLAHSTLEPMNCTAHVQADHCDIWVPSQSQSQTGGVAADLTGLKQEQISVHITYLGGGFGRRGESDYVTHAVLMSQAVGKPVKVIWSREEDTQHDFYRPAVVSRFQIGLDDNGKLMYWGNQSAGSSILKRLVKTIMPGFLSWLPVTGVIGDPIAEEGAKEIPYFEDLDFENEIVNLPVPVGFWRSVGHSYNGFFIESAIDEAAHAAEADPAQYRLDHMHDAREITVAKRVMDLAGWGNAQPGRVQGIAVHKSFGTYAVQVVEMSVADNKTITLHRISCVVDCGVVVNPNTVKAQVESGIVFGLTAAETGDITITNGKVDQSNFHDYTMLKLDQLPKIDVAIIPSAEAPTGIGEPGTPPIAPAITNAIFQATGERIRHLPIARHGYKIGRASA